MWIDSKGDVGYWCLCIFRDYLNTFGLPLASAGKVVFTLRVKNVASTNTPRAVLSQCGTVGYAECQWHGNLLVYCFSQLTDFTGYLAQLHCLHFASLSHHHKIIFTVATHPSSLCPTLLWPHWQLFWPSTRVYRIK